MNKILVLFVLSMLCFSMESCQEKPTQKPKYVFFFIGDGMGVNQVNATEMYLTQVEGKIGNKRLNFTQFPVVSMATTYCLNSAVTCSAASGTALATGIKTIIGTIGMDSAHIRPLYSIAALAKEQGYKVGIATCVGVNHATPAAFYAHQPSRNMYYEIGMDMFKAGFDFYAGGGFINPTNDSTARSLYEVAQDSGYAVVRGEKAFEALTEMPQRMILFQEKENEGETLMPRIDRKEGMLSPAQMTENAIKFLSKDNDKGFFLMMEGGKIDWAGHSNDAASMVNEVIDFTESVQKAIDFYHQHPDETLIVITADHETGGISVGSNLQILQYQTCSKTGLSRIFTHLRNTKGKNASWDDVKSILKEKLGFWNQVEVSPKEEKMLKDEFQRSIRGNDIHFDESLYAKDEQLASIAIHLLNQKAEAWWAHGNHTAGFVPVFAMGVGSERFQGIQDNAKISLNIRNIAYSE